MGKALDSYCIQGMSNYNSKHYYQEEEYPTPHTSLNFPHQVLANNVANKVCFVCLFSSELSDFQY